MNIKYLFVVFSLFLSLNVFSQTNSVLSTNLVAAAPEEHSFSTDFSWLVSDAAKAAFPNLPKEDYAIIVYLVARYLRNYHFNNLSADKINWFHKLIGHIALKPIVAAPVSVSAPITVAPVVKP